MKKTVDCEDIFVKYAGKNKPVRILIEILKGSSKDIVLATVFSLIKNSPIFIMPLVTAGVINAAVKPGPTSWRTIIIYSIIGLVCISLNVPLQNLETHFSSRVVRSIGMNLRNSIVRKLQQMTISFHKSIMSGKIISKILRDVDNIEQLSKSVISTVLMSIINVAIFAAITFCKSPLVGLFFVLTLPIASFIVIKFKRVVKDTAVTYRKEVERMSANVNEMVEMIPVTKSHGLEMVESERAFQNFADVFKSAVQVDTIQAKFSASSWVAFNGFQLICLCFSGFLAIYGKITPGDVSLYQAYFNALLNHISTLLLLYPIFTKGVDSITSTSEILSSDDIEHNDGKYRLVKLNGDIEFRNVSFAYRDDPTVNVVDNFVLNVKKGECVAIVGPSGSGKSTILNLIIGFNLPTSGKILIDGHSTTDINLRKYRQHISVVSQTSILFAGSIRDNITYGKKIYTEDEVDRVVRLANLSDLISHLPDGIDTYIGEHGGRLSGGQRQRVAIARAMIRKPDIVIFDEATSALDNISERKVQVAMDELIKGKTTFIVAHRLSTVKNADRIIVMKDGKICEQGTYDQLLNLKGEFYQLSMGQENTEQDLLHQD